MYRLLREKEGDKVIIIVNLSGKEVTTILQTQYDKGIYTELFTGKQYELKGKDTTTLPAWGYRVLTSSKSTGAMGN